MGKRASKPCEILRGHTERTALWQFLFCQLESLQERSFELSPLIWHDPFSKPGTWPPAGLQLLDGLTDSVQTCAENKSMNYECNADNCVAKDCKNRTIADSRQYSSDGSLQVFLTDRRGYGLKTNREINADEYIVQI